ncbi:J domain-containing protein [Singulisphaera acidiphila]|uniref:DnaJ-class molecular chaperone with C-terminal Zn finger domain n=1 Tax=Singulisphaera acidiphila (strain ATCC BAA-1392 / DSM 18658 / VKM B-2454 / MOB10) TaxID=886293 RepID=L0DEH9_SINAD|nr:J domain-containing protein [Singulisphaera acidiphila]AGA27662.1 DnaJ-class molecular chaperone with C-terminal Zn finger domain [Singulisphaera acidiphila DSM 18658]
MSSAHQRAGNSPAIAYGFEIDPSGILGVSNNASLQDIRDAYRLKARKHHPDHGGDEWAFRIVARAYEILSTARVAGRVVQEAQKSSESARPAPFRKPAPGDSEWLRPGRRDPWIEPPRLVDVEILSLRFEMADPTDLLLMPASERNLSCCLSLTWTAPPPGPWGEQHPDAPLARKLLTDTFEALPARTHATSSWSHSEGPKFEGWLSYPTSTRAHEAFRILHEDLNGCGLGVNQWTRELIIPRGGR